MKRNDPKTGKPFVVGTIREDGYVFRQYTAKKRKDGFFIESWTTPKKFKEIKAYLKEANKRNQKKRRLNPMGRAKALIDSAISRCKTTGGKITITQEWIAKKIENGVCEISGLKFDLESKNYADRKSNPYAPSLDRIDSNNKDYTEDNVRVVLSAVNIAINFHGLDVMMPIFRGIVKNEV